MLHNVMFIFFIHLLYGLNGETVNVDSAYTSDVSCTSFPCIINCNVANSCRGTSISCPTAVGGGSCTINVASAASYGAYQSVINGGSSTYVELNLFASRSLQYGTINSYEVIGSTLNITATGYDALQYVTLHAPYGVDSELNILCGDGAAISSSNADFCAYMKIYDDYSTKVTLIADEYRAFLSTEISNIFNTSGLGISKDSSIPVKYRGDVRLIARQTFSFHSLEYYGTNHGNWYIESDGLHGFYNAEIYADHDFRDIQQSYEVSVNSGTTQSQSIGFLTLYVSQPNVDITLIGETTNAFRYSDSLTLSLISTSTDYVINSLNVYSNAQYAFRYVDIEIAGNIRDLNIESDTDGYQGFYYAEFVIQGSILNDVTITMNGDYQSLFSSTISMDQIKGDLAFLAEGDRGRCCQSMTFRSYRGVNGDVSFIDESLADGLSFYQSDIIIGDVGGNLKMIDESSVGRAFYQSDIAIGDVEGDFVLFEDSSSGSSSGYSFYDVDFNLGDISGKLEFIENSLTGYSFQSCTFDIGTVYGEHLKFETVTDNGGNGFRSSTYSIDEVKGNLLLYSETANSFRSNTLTVLNGVGGNFEVLDTSTAGYGGYDSVFTIIGDIGGYVSIQDLTDGASGGRSFYSTEWYLAVDHTIGGDVEFIENSAYGYSFYSSKYYLGSILGSLTFESRNDVGRQSFYSSTYVIDSVKNGNLSLLANSVGSFRTCTFTVNNGINGDIKMIDVSSGGLGFYNSDFYFYGKTSGSVYIYDHTEGSSGGRTAYSTNFVFGDILGNVEIIENSFYGYSFGTSTFTMDSISGSLSCLANIDNGRQAFDNSDFTIGSIGGSLTLLTATYGAFSENAWTVSDGIGGDVLMVDTSSGGLGFYNADFYFYGVIDGSILVADNTSAAAGGRIAVSTNFKFGNVSGDVGFIENSLRGDSFSITDYEIDSVGGDLLFAALIDNNYEAFYPSTYTIGKVYGDLSFISNTHQCFRDAEITVDTVLGTTSLIGRHEDGYDFYDASLSIESSPNVIIDTLGPQSLYNFHSYFGFDVGTITITATQSVTTVHTLYSAEFNAQYANELILNCQGNADCSDMKIYCPEDNQENLCRVYCDSDANCDNLDLYTTNGWCADATIYCTSAANDCEIATTSQIFCTQGTILDYGSTSSFCQMNLNDDDEFYCLDYSTAYCSNEQHVCLTGDTTTTTTTTTTPSPTTSAPSTTPTFNSFIH